MQGSDVHSIVEPSAAGTLRMMTAQHNAVLNSPNERAQQESVPIQQQHQQQPQTVIKLYSNTYDSLYFAFNNFSIHFTAITND